MAVRINTQHSVTHRSMGQMASGQSAMKQSKSGEKEGESHFTRDENPPHRPREGGDGAFGTSCKAKQREEKGHQNLVKQQLTVLSSE